jgi:geranylgeranyl diphosphate synthase type I
LTAVDGPTAPASLIDIGDRAAARIDHLLADESQRWVAVDAALAEPFTALRQLVAAAGKRLRPAFVHWGFIAAGGQGSPAVVENAGAAVELLHTCALIHDDVIDGSTRRRGLPCTHVAFADRHRQRQWRGEAARFGQAAAILVGDLAFAYSDVLLTADGDVPLTARRVFDDLRVEVNIGQYLDLMATASGEASVERAHTICVYKSGKYTVERPLQLGAALFGGGGQAATDAALSAFGVALGEAFQLRDDLLGAFGDGRLLGKDVGEDIREGKPTALYALARARAEGAGARLLAERFGQADVSEDELAAISDLFESTGARATVEATVDRLGDAALTALERAPIAPVAAQELRALAAFVTARRH